MPASKIASWLRIAGINGISAPIYTLTLILIAVASYPQFSWTDNALSDLGVVPGVTSSLFNLGLITSGVLFLLFATGLVVLLYNTVIGKAGAFLFTLACWALLSIGLFPENVEPSHYQFSVGFFSLLPISMLVIATAFLRTKQRRLAGFTLLTAVVAAAPWALWFSVHYVPGVAIPEFVSALAGAVWAIVLGYKMIMEASRAKAS